MAYLPQAWANLPSTSTPINAARLAFMETGIQNAHTLVDNHTALTSTAHGGAVLPVGGTSQQVLKKNSSTNFDTSWADQVLLSDSTPVALGVASAGVGATAARYDHVHPATVVITQQATDYTLVLADGGTEVEGTKATAQNITIPPNSSVAFPIGTVINVRQIGAGQITIVAGSGVTIRIPRGAKTAVQYASLALVKRGTNEWVVSGDATT